VGRSCRLHITKSSRQYVKYLSMATDKHPRAACRLESLLLLFHSTAQLQYVEDSESVTRSTWPLVNSAKTELQVQKELDKKRFLTSAPRGRGATPYIETVEYQDMIYWEIESNLVTMPNTIVGGVLNCCMCSNVRKQSRFIDTSAARQ